MNVENNWHLIYVEDDQKISNQVKKYIEKQKYANRGFIINIVEDFATALQYLSEHHCDLIILDVKGSELSVSSQKAGKELFDQIRQYRFIPTVFYTAVPNDVHEFKSSLVKVVTKTDGSKILFKQICELFDAGFPQVVEAFQGYVQSVQRKYMWEFIEERWEQLTKHGDYKTLAYLLAQRLSLALAGTGISELATALGDTDTTTPIEGRLHPMQYYIMPPLGTKPLAGDLYYGGINNEQGYWILLTPSCDLHQDKADWLMFARCIKVVDLPKYKAYKQNPNSEKKNNLKNIIGNKEPRFHSIPGVFEIPHMVVDFQQLVIITSFQIVDEIRVSSLRGLRRIATLASPFAESLQTRFVNYSGRIGTPDIDTDLIINQLQAGENS